MHFSIISLVLLVNHYFLVTPLYMLGFSNREIQLFSILYVHTVIFCSHFLVTRDFFTYTVFYIGWIQQNKIQLFSTFLYTDPVIHMHT